MPTSSSGAGRPCSGDKVAVSGGRPCGSANTSVYSDSNFNNLGSSEGVESALGVVTSPRHSFLRRPPPPITLSHCPTSAGDYRTTAADPRTPPLNTTSSSMVACRLLEEVEAPAVMFAPAAPWSALPLIAVESVLSLGKKQTRPTDLTQWLRNAGIDLKPNVI